MNYPLIEQAIYGSGGAGGYRFLAKSPHFRDAWLPEAQRICTAFGERPAGIACPACLFVQPFDAQHVAVVQVADHGLDDAGRPGTLRFRLLIVPRTLYAALEGDPFLIADTFPPAWDATSALPALTWTAGAPPMRPVAALQTVLDQAHSATLLGATQALVDGGHVVFARAEPDATMLRNLWALLPSGSRTELWPATFAFGNLPAFHAVAVPPALVPTGPPWVHEEEAGDYPDGRYELNLQIAIESGDQDELDKLFARKTPRHMLRLAIELAVVLLVAVIGITIVVPFVMHKYGLEAKMPNANSASSVAAPELPPENECPPLSASERHDFAVKLQQLAEHLHLKDVPGGDSDKELTASLAALDAQLPAPEPRHDHRPLSKLGAIQRQLRALLWTRNVPGYNERGLNAVELVEKLETHLIGERQP